MSEKDPLVDAMRANPNDDAPRLVWADREGGDRGEYVVICCTLARRGVPDETRRRYSERAKELFEMHHDEWTGGLGKRAHCTFSRGFLDHIHTDHIDTFLARIDAVAACSPLLTGLQFHEVATTSWPEAVAKLRVVLHRFEDRVYRLRFGASVPDSDPVHVNGRVHHGDIAISELLATDGRHLSHLELMWSGLTRHALPKLGTMERLRRLTIGHPALSGADIVELVERMPKLQMLGLFWSLTKLGSDDVDRILACPRIKQLWQLELHDCGVSHFDKERLRKAYNIKVL